MAIINVIKYEGDNNQLVWKHPIEDFNIGSQLVVHETQEAIFFNGGQAQDLFGPGTYTLTTKNFPFIGGLLKKFTGGESIFHCEVYFINKAEATSVRWGTPDRVTIIEPTEGIPMKLGAGGDMTIRVEDSRKLLLKLVGTEAALGKEQFSNKFRELISSRIGNYLADTVVESGISFFELDRHRVEFSDKLKELISPVFADYGIELVLFNLSRFVLPEDDPNYQRMIRYHGDKFAQKADNELKMKDLEAAKDRNVVENQIKLQNANAEADVMETVELRKAEIAAKAKILDAQALKAKRDIEGYSYQEERGFDVAQSFAEKQSDSGITELGVGIGTMSAVGTGVGNYLNATVGAALAAAAGNKAAGGMMPGAGIKCAKCGADLPENAKFCLSCGEKVVHIQPGQLICPACGKATPEGKFCMECGAPLVNKCPNCGSEVPAGGKFCLECGTKISAEG
ncbi:MAG: SPFH domain-containing protein [Lachnospiraceae bacterium]|nr:SPFH domain-containing protein [Lachnospiraceae bacterium]